MKKIYVVLFICIASLSIKAATFTVTVSGLSYSPSSLTVTVGDQVFFQPAGHPTAQTSQSTWMSNGTATLAGGWGSFTSNFSFSATATGTVFYVCQAHVGSGMKGTITVVSGVGVNETVNNFLNEFNVFPNPASEKVKVSLGLAEASIVNIKLFNVLGQEVNSFVNQNPLNNGNHDFTFELPQGILPGNYFIEVSSGERRSIKKLMVTK